MSEEIEVETKDLQEAIEEVHEERERQKAEEKATSWTRLIAVTTALLAVVAAVAALQAGSLANEALLAKEDSIQQQEIATDTWAYYQAEGIKAAIAALPATPAAAQQVNHYKDRQTELSKQAKENEAARDEKNVESKKLLHEHEGFALVVTLTQVAIALSAIAALTKQKPVWFVSLCIGACGTILFIRDFLPHSS